MEIPEELKGKLTIDITTAARILGIGVNQAYAAAKAGEIPTLRLGRRLLVPVAPLLKLLGVEEE
jgi:excisionase family DNA binding protein